jgi:hypothetical protein
VAKESGYAKIGRRSLRLFGVLTGAGIGATIAAKPAIGVAVGGVGATLLQATAKEAAKYLFDLSASVGADWKPVVFGNWYRQKISDLLRNDPDE